MIRWFCLSLLFLTTGTLAAQAQAEGPVYYAGDKSNFALNKGNHLVILGNALAERMIHDGQFEAMLYAAFPEHDLVIRNLGYSGDEIGGYTSKPDPMKRLRSLDFGTADQWLYANAPVPQPGKLKPGAPVKANRFENVGTKPDVIIAMFGYNESFAGEAGLPKFKETLTDFIKHQTSQKYNGKTPPRLILCSPIPHEDLQDPNLPDGKENNARLKLYSDAMKEVALANKVGFVDLQEMSKNYIGGLKSITENGIHLNTSGHYLAAVEIVQQGLSKGFNLEKHIDRMDEILKFVQDKNLHWFQRYRATDGYSVHGDRAFLKFTNGQSNYEVGQRELEVLDQLVANREAAIHRIARGEKNVKPDDSNLPPFIPVVTNKPGKNPDGSHVFNSGEEELKHLTVHKDLQVNLFADEKRFPELINPVQMAFDTKGRLWVAVWPTYPHWKPTTPMNDKLLIFEDTDGDGKADKCITFAGDLHNPTGFEFWNGGVIVAQGPDVLFLKDTDGDDKYDVKERILHGLDTADTHHTANSFTLDPGGALYFQEGTFHHSQIETPWGPPRRVISGAVFRYEPRTKKIDVHVAYNFANPHGHAFDRWGNDIVVDGTGAVPYHGTLFSGHVNFPTKHSTSPTVYKQRTRPCPGIEFVSSSHLPESMRGNLWVPNVIGLQGILQYKIEQNGASLKGTEEPLILSSNDPNFRPADVEQAPDGSVYFVDWHNPIIGHMQHNLRDPNRNKEKGRIYRITAKDRPLLTPVKISGEPIPVLLDLLKSHDDRVRYRTRIELSARPTAEVIAATKKMVAELDPFEPDADHHRLELLWVHQQHNVVNANLLANCLVRRTNPPEVRAAAIKVAWAWRDRLSNILEILLHAAADPAPNVRLEAIRAASFLTVPEAIEIVIQAQDAPLDEYLNYQIKETLKTLDPIVVSAKQANHEIKWVTEAGKRFRLRNLNVTDLLKEPRDMNVCLELLARAGIADNIRQEAVRELAKQTRHSELTIIMSAIQSLDNRATGVETSTVFDLVRLLTSRPKNELIAARKELEKLATTAKQPLFRQIGYVSLMNVDGKIDAVLKLAEKDKEHLVDLVNAVPLVTDPALRSSLFKILDIIIANIPYDAAEAPKCRFVRIELPGTGTLTLAEVEVYSAGVNVARRGRASQKNTAHGGDASRAIDGNTNGSYGAGSSTHTEEGTANPWWEVDLGDKYAVDKIVVYNRTEGKELGARLNNFTIKLLDSQRQPIWEAAKNPAPEVSAEFTPQGQNPGSNLRRAAMLAMTSVRGEETRTFATLAHFLEKNVDADTAIRGLQRLPQNTWARDRAPALTELLLKQIQATPAAERTTDSALAKLEFADSLAGLLPADDAKKVRGQLGELGVRVIKLNTVFEKMAYDKEVVVARAGKPVEIVLENSDLMPHNFVVLQPGSLEEIGLLSEEQAQDPNFAKAGFVPKSSKVIAKSALVPPRETTRISVNVPNKPGVYPYVCTYPGHWRRMYGALYVVADLDAYQANPEAYLASAKIEPLDALLRDHRPRTEWKLEDLAEAVAALPKTGGRNWAAGKEAFKVGSCIACHKLDGTGAEFGPDLLKLDPTYKEVDVLRHILNPSEKIVEKYQTYTFEMKSGKTLTGMIVSENSDVIRVIENPLLKAEPLELQVRDLEEKTKLPTSMMPRGLLDKLTRDEVLDLIAYLIARGDQKHPVFGGGHEHGHKH